MKVSLDETGFGRKCHWMKVFLDESVFGRVFFFFFRIWMKVYLTASVTCFQVSEQRGLNGISCVMF